MAVPFLVYGAMAGLQLLSGVQQANAIQRQAELQKELDQFNIEQSQLDAFNAEADGYTQMARYQNVIDEISAKTRVQYIAADVDPNFGTAKDLQEQNTLTGKLNLLDLQNQAHKRAMGYQKEALTRRGQSSLNMIGANLQARTTQNASMINAAGTLITGYERSGGFDKPGAQNTKGGVDWNSVQPMTNEESYNIQYGGYLGRIG